MSRLLLTALLALLVTGAPASAQQTHAERDSEQLTARSAAAKAWEDMTPAERRAVVRRERAGREQAFVQARAAASGPAKKIGRWTKPFEISGNYRGYAVHAALLRTGKVLFYGYPLHPEQRAFRGNETYAWLWNPKKGKGNRAFKDVTVRDPNGQTVSLYCSGMSFLPDGRLLVVGGNLLWPEEDEGDAYTEPVGLNRAFLFDPKSEEWTELPRPADSQGRWYPSQVLLPDGRSMIISGFTEDAPGGVLNEDIEIYEPPTRENPLGSFQILSGDAQRRDSELYPHLFVLPNGKVALAGPDITDTAIFDPNALSAPWTELPRQAVQRIGGNAVLTPRGPRGSSRVLQLAGEPYDNRPHRTSEQIDFSDATPTWSPGPGLKIPRSYPNTVLLPDRALAVIGGIDVGFGDHPYSPRGRQMELLAPGASRFRLGPAQVEDRGYHSTALMLPDGSVLSAGDDRNPTQDGTRKTSSPFDTAEIYKPGYFFKGKRPKIRKAPRVIRVKRHFRVATRSRVKSAVLASPSAVTHAVDMSQRIVPLRIKGRRKGKNVTLAAPPTSAVAPPGWYMLFVMDRKGRPSKAKFLRLR